MGGGRQWWRARKVWICHRRRELRDPSSLSWRVFTESASSRTSKRAEARKLATRKRKRTLPYTSGTLACTLLRERERQMEGTHRLIVLPAT